MEDYGGYDGPMLSAAEKQALQRITRAALEYRNRNGRELGSQFRDLPNHLEQPRYYELVVHPRSLGVILDHLDQGVYTSPVQVFADLELVCLNGQTANNRSSNAAQDAAKLEGAIREFWDGEADLPKVEHLTEAGMSYEVGSPAEDGVSRKRIRLSLPDGSAESMENLGALTDHLWSDTLAAAAAGGEPPAPQDPDAVAYAQLMGVELPETPADSGTEATASPSRALNMGPRPRGRPRTKGIGPITPVKPRGVGTPTPSAHASPMPSYDNLATQANELPVEAGAPGAYHVPMEDDQMTADYDDGADEPEADAESVPQGTSQPDTQSGWLFDPHGKERIVSWHPKHSPDASEQNRNAHYAEIVQRLLSEQDHKTGRFLAHLITSLPSQTEDPLYYQRVQEPYLCLNDIEQKAKAGKYYDGVAFDRELTKLFSDARLWLRDDSVRFGDIAVVQRLWQEVTKFDPSPNGSPDVRYNKRATEPLHSLNLKGQVIRVGDWLHLHNDRNPGKPIVAQVFGCLKYANTTQRGVTVLRYLRPEDTMHLPTRTFYEGEIFKASKNSTFHAEDILEKVCVMWVSRWLKGRPKSPHYTPEMPTYVVESRYLESSKQIKKIKNWLSCQPEPMRRFDPMEDITLFEYSFTPVRVASPFAPSATQSAHLAQQGTSKGAGKGGVPFTGQSEVDLENAAIFETFDPLPADIARRFRSDPATDEVLWFPVPPLAAPALEGPQHSLAYLAHLAQAKLDGQQTAHQPSKRKASVLSRLQAFVTAAEGTDGA